MGETFVEKDNLPKLNIDSAEVEEHLTDIFKNFQRNTAKVRPD